MQTLYYKDLIVWKKSMDLVTAIYSLVATLPSNELYGLTSQNETFVHFDTVKYCRRK